MSTFGQDDTVLPIDAPIELVGHRDALLPGPTKSELSDAADAIGRAGSRVVGQVRRQRWNGSIEREIQQIARVRDVSGNIGLADLNRIGACCWREARGPGAGPAKSVLDPGAIFQSAEAQTAVIADVVVGLHAVVTHQRQRQYFWGAEVDRDRAQHHWAAGDSCAIDLLGLNITSSIGTRGKRKTASVARQPTGASVDAVLPGRARREASDVNRRDIGDAVAGAEPEVSGQFDGRHRFRSMVFTSNEPFPLRGRRGEGVKNGGVPNARKKLKCTPVSAHWTESLPNKRSGRRDRQVCSSILAACASHLAQAPQAPLPAAVSNNPSSAPAKRVMSKAGLSYRAHCSRSRIARSLSGSRAKAVAVSSYCRWL